MKRYAVDYAHKKKGPVRATFGDRRVAAVVDRKKDVGCAGEVGESFFEREGVGSLHEHEGHGWAEEDDVGVLVLVEVFALEIPVLIFSPRTQRRLRRGRIVLRRSRAREWTYSSQNDILCGIH